MQESGQTGFQCRGNSFNIIETYIMFSAFDSANITSVKPAEFSQHFLRPAAIRS